MSRRLTIRVVDDIPRFTRNITINLTTIVVVQRLRTVVMNKMIVI